VIKYTDILNFIIRYFVSITGFERPIEDRAMQGWCEIVLLMCKIPTT